MKREFYGEAVCLGKRIRYDLLTESGRYGVCVEYGGERVILSGLTAERGQAENLLRIMVRGAVTPVTARDVAEDFLAGRKI